MVQLAALHAFLKIYLQRVASGLFLADHFLLILRVSGNASERLHYKPL